MKSYGGKYGSQLGFTIDDERMEDMAKVIKANENWYKIIKEFAEGGEPNIIPITLDFEHLHKGIINGHASNPEYQNFVSLDLWGSPDWQAVDETKKWHGSIRQILFENPPGSLPWNSFQLHWEGEGTDTGGTPVLYSPGLLRLFFNDSGDGNVVTCYYQNFHNNTYYDWSWRMKVASPNHIQAKSWTYDLWYYLFPQYYNII